MKHIYLVFLPYQKSYADIDKMLTLVEAGMIVYFILSFSSHSRSMSPRNDKASFTHLLFLHLCFLLKQLEREAHQNQWGLYLSSKIAKSTSQTL